jgi:hypothetical protein
MQGGLRVDSKHPDASRQLATRVRIGVTYAQTLPPKPQALHMARNLL